MFLVVLGPKPKKIYEKTEEKIKQKLTKLFETLEVNPWPAKEYDLVKIAGLKDSYRIRIGRNRIAYYVNTDKKEITIFRLELRSETTYKF